MLQEDDGRCHADPRRCVCFVLDGRKSPEDRRHGGHWIGQCWDRGTGMVDGRSRLVECQLALLSRIESTAVCPCPVCPPNWETTQNLFTAAVVVTCDVTGGAGLSQTKVFPVSC